MVSLFFCVSHAGEMLKEREKKLASQPGKPIDTVVYCFYSTITKEVTRGSTGEYGLQFIKICLPYDIY